MWPKQVGLQVGKTTQGLMGMLHKRCRLQMPANGSSCCWYWGRGFWSCVGAAQVGESGTAIDIPCMHARSAAVLFSTFETSRLDGFDLNSMYRPQTYRQPSPASPADSGAKANATRTGQLGQASCRWTTKSGGIGPRHTAASPKDELRPEGRVEGWKQAYCTVDASHGPSLGRLTRKPGPGVH